MPWIYLALGTIGGAAAFVYGFAVRKKRDLVQTTPSSKIRSAALGMVELEGTAQPCKKLFLSPFSKNKAVYYRFLVTVKRHKREDVVIAQFESSEPFYLQDETGRALIVPAGADLRWTGSRKFSGGAGGNSADMEIIRNGLSSLGKVFPHLNFSDRIECEETCVMPGDPVYALGNAEAFNDEAEAQKTGTATLILSKKKGSYFCISNTNQKSVLQNFNADLFVYQYVAPVISVACLYMLVIALRHGS